MCTWRRRSRSRETLNTAVEVRYGIHVPNMWEYGDPRVLAELALLAEECGWDGFFVWDHVLFDLRDPPDVCDPWVALAAAASRTRRIRLGAMVTPVPRRRPWKLAREVASLDLLSDGRVVFGAGLGVPADAEFEAYGEDSDARASRQAGRRTGAASPPLER